MTLLETREAAPLTAAPEQQHRTLSQLVAEQADPADKNEQITIHSRPVHEYGFPQFLDADKEENLPPKTESETCPIHTIEIYDDRPDSGDLKVPARDNAQQEEVSEVGSASAVRRMELENGSMRVRTTNGEVTAIDRQTNAGINENISRDASGNWLWTTQDSNRPANAPPSRPNMLTSAPVLGEDNSITLQTVNAQIRIAADGTYIAGPRGN